MKKLLIILVVLLAALSISFAKDIHSIFDRNGKEASSGQKMYAGDAKPSVVTIVKQWDLPQVLDEVSGIAYMDANRFACVQDEEGIIFIYNTETGKIEREIPFAGAGDYEGITLAGSTAYIVRSDGLLYEVGNYLAAQPTVTSYKTPLRAEHNIEGLTFDEKHHRLLLSVKDEDPVNRDGKGVYAFDLSTKKLDGQPLFAISNSEALQSGGKKKKGVRPSDIGIHPATGHHYIVDGPRAVLFLVDTSGRLLGANELGASFVKAEGITFDPSGKIFISNEKGKAAAANIMEITIGKDE